MPLSLSVDLQWRVIMLYFYRDYHVSEIADLLIISTKSVRRILINSIIPVMYSPLNKAMGLTVSLQKWYFFNT